MAEADRRSKRRKKKRQQQLRMRIVLFGLFFVVALCVIAFYVYRHTPSRERVSAAEYFGVTDGEAAIVVDGTLPDAKGTVIDGSVYTPYETVQRAISRAIFYDEYESEIIVTAARSKRTWAVSGGRTADGEAETVDGTLYISPAFLKEWSAASVEEYSDPARIVIRTNTTFDAVHPAEDTVIRQRAGIRSPILTDVSAGTSLEALDVHADGTVDEDKTDGWTCVTTADGYTGYIEDEDLEDGVDAESVETEDSLGSYTTRQLDGKVNMAFHQTTSRSANSALSDAISSVSGVNVVAPTWFFLEDTDGSVTSIASSEYVTTAHEAGLQVWAVLNDFDGGAHSAEETAEALKTDTTRSAIVRSVMDALKDAGADGLNIDFEHVTESSAPAFLEMVREFSAECRNASLTLSVDNYVPSYTTYMDRSEQARVADYVVVMCYDEHTSSSEEAGSVASLPYVEDGVEGTVREASAEKTIAAIPFYTRLWETAGDGSLTSTTYGMKDAENAVETLGMTPSWDETAAQNYAESTSGGIRYQIWLEDADSIAAKMNVISESGCAGVAEWKLGFETEDIWQVISDGLGE